MKTHFIRLTKLALLSVGAILALSVTSCKEDEADGDWDHIVWKSAKYEQTTVGSDNYYVAAPDGDYFSFSCSNYDVLNLSDVVITEDGETGHYNLNIRNSSFSNDVCEVKVEGKNVEVRLKYNEGESRKVDVIVSCLDVFDHLKFVQQGVAKQ